MLSGIIVGILINNFLLPNDFIEYYLINQIFFTISSLFLILLKMIVLPLIFVSIISGIVSINDVSTLGRLGIKTFSLYILTTLVAITFALFISSFVSYDSVGQITNDIQSNVARNIDQKNIILSIFPSNFFSASVSILRASDRFRLSLAACFSSAVLGLFFRRCFLRAFC